MNEQFSAFLDNEATRDEADAVVNGLLRDDDDMRASWTRQHWVRETLRSSAIESSVALDMEFSERVMQAIHADDADTAHGGDAHPAVVAMTTPARRRRWPAMAGFAVAASAAGFALFATQPMRLGGGSTVATNRTVAVNTAGMTGATRVASAGSSMPLAGDLFHNVADRVEDVGDTVSQWQVSNSIQAKRLNGYLFEHNGLARGYGLSATTPGFVRVATYGWDSAR